MLRGEGKSTAGLKPPQRRQQRASASDGKAPRTARGERTLRKILEAAREEFGEHGFSDASIVGITSRADVALGTFYTYFDSKEAVFRALVRDMSAQVRDHVLPAFKDARDGIDAEGRALAAFLEFASGQKQVYRIIDEAEFVDPAAFREHYETTATRIAARLTEAEKRGELSADLTPEAIDTIAWAVMGANVFLGLRYAVWGNGDPNAIATVMSRLLRYGLSAR